MAFRGQVMATTNIVKERTNREMATEDPTFNFSMAVI